MTNITEDDEAIVIVTEFEGVEILAAPSAIPDNGAAFLRLYDHQHASYVSEWLTEVETVRLAFKLLESVGVPAFDASEMEEAKREAYARGFGHGKEVGAKAERTAYASGLSRGVEVAADGAEERVKELQGMIDELRAQIKELNDDNDYLQEEMDRLGDEAWSLQNEVDELKVQLQIIDASGTGVIG